MSYSKSQDMSIQKKMSKLNNLLAGGNSPKSTKFQEIPAEKPKVNKNKLFKEKEKILNNIADRKNTISTFCFKQVEKDEDPFLVPVIKKITNDGIHGSMTVSELWSDKTLRK